MPNYLHSGKEPQTDLPQNSQEEKPCSPAARRNPQDADRPGSPRAAHVGGGWEPQGAAPLFSLVEGRQRVGPSALGIMQS